MDSAAKSAAAAPSSGDAETAMAVLPNGKRDDRDDDADGIANNGGHMVCPHCGKGPYRRYSNLAAHVEVFHSGLKPPPRLKYACTCHGRLFWHRWVRDQHERDAVRTTCRHCGREMARSNLRRHAHRCKYRPGGPAEPAHACTECGLAFMTNRGAAATLLCRHDACSSTHRKNPTRRSSPPGRDGRHTPIISADTLSPLWIGSLIGSRRNRLCRNAQKNANIVLGRLLNCNTTNGLLIGLFDFASKVLVIVCQDGD